MIPQKDFEKELRRIKCDEKLFGGHIEVVYAKMDPHVSAGIDPYTYRIEVRADPEWNPAYDRRTRKWAKRYRVDDPFLRTGEDVTRHEAGHWGDCPRTVDNHAEITDAVIRGLKKHNKENFADVTANMFEDLVVNSSRKSDGRDMAGQVYFWDDQFRHAAEKGEYDPRYEAFVKLHIVTHFRDANRMLGKYFRNEGKVNGIVKEVCGRLEVRRGDTDALMNENDWPRLAEDFADLMAPLLKKGMAISLPLNAFTKMMKMPAEKRKTALKRYGSGRGIPEHMERDDALDSLYMALARPIPIDAKAEGRLGIPVTGYSWRPFNPDEDDLRTANIHRFAIGAKAEAVPTVARHHLEMEVPTRSSLKTFPDFTMSIIDTSSSMKEGLPDGDESGSTAYIPWGDKSKYHYALLGWYGILKDLDRRAILPYINVGVACFSNETRTAVERGKQLHRVKETLLNPEFGVTEMDVKEMAKAFSPRKSVALTLSDGEIQNWDEIKEDYRKLIRPHIYFHVQLGELNPACEDIKSWGHDVFQVSNGKDLQTLTQGLVVGTYSQYVQQKSRKVELPEVGP